MIRGECNMYYAGAVPSLHADDTAIHEGHVVSYYVWLKLARGRGRGGDEVLSQKRTNTISIHYTVHHITQRKGRRMRDISLTLLPFLCVI